MKTLTVITVRPLAVAVPETIPKTLEAMQKLVGGWIERVRLAPGIDLYVNEEGLIHDLPPTRICPFVYEGKGPIRGSFFICGVNVYDGESRSLTADELAKWLAIVESWPMVIPVPSAGVA